MIKKVVRITKKRINELRKTLSLSQEQFGKRLGVGKSAISYLESGRSKLTEQMLLLICKEFNVNEDWLRNGTGEMFRQYTQQEEVALYVSELLEDNGTHPVYGFIKDILRTYTELDSKSQQVVDEVIKKLVNNIKKEH